MDLDMWVHPAVKENVRRLQSYGNRLIPVGNGELASGLTGDGRMAEPEDIVRILTDFFQKKQDLSGKKILLTAGPTHEAVDPVRFIGNRSTGKMGIALAEAAAERGAEVHLILGPSGLTPRHENVHLVRVQSAREMHAAALNFFPQADAAIFAAAVADFRPKHAADQKIKKQAGQDEMTIVLEKNPDIAADLGKIKTEKQIAVGFALETENGREHAARKLRKKNLDFIVLNSLADKGAGFGHDTNKVTLIDRDNNIRDFELKSKRAVAEDILDEIVRRFER